MSPRSVSAVLESILTMSSDEWRPGLLLLWQAAQLAKARKKHEWSYAVTMHELRAAGLPETTVRLLVEENALVNLEETTGRDQTDRSFQPVRGPTLFERSCFVLTDIGVRLTNELLSSQGMMASKLPNPAAPVSASAVPIWDGERRQLWFGEVLVKHFRQPAGNQEEILEEFQRHQWPHRIDNPFEETLEQTAYDSMVNGAKRLNLHQLVHCLHFFPDGTKTGVCWEVLPAERPESVPRASRERPRASRERS